MSEQSRRRTAKHGPPKPWPEAPAVKRTMAGAFDEWMRRYIEEPDRFLREFQAVGEFIDQGGLAGHATNYGHNCAAYLQQLMEGK